MTELRRLYCWFFSRNPVWYVVIVTIVGFYVVWEKDFGLQKQDHFQQRIIYSENMIRLHAVEFQTYAAAFVSAVLAKNADLEKHKRRLKENLNAQYATADVFTHPFDKETTKAAVEFQSRLQVMIKAVNQTQDVLTMKNFWEAASDLLVARNLFLHHVNRQLVRISAFVKPFHGEMTFMPA